LAPFTPLLRPGSYFAAGEVNFFRVMAVFGILLAAGPLTIYGVGWITTANVNGTVMVDNPERPPEAFCGDDGCTEPKRIERDVDSVLWEQLNDLIGPAFIIYPLVLGILTLLLHAGVWLVGGDRGWFPTFAVAAWGLLPSLGIVAAMLVGLWMTIEPVTVAPGDDIGTALKPLERQFQAFDTYRIGGTIVESVWAALIWRAGLREQQGLPNPEATILAGIVAGLTAVGTILL
jgi:hypothetical protein